MKKTKIEFGSKNLIFGVWILIIFLFFSPFSLVFGQGSSQKKVFLNFSGTELKEIILTFQKLTNKRFLFDEKLVQGKKVNFLSSSGLPTTALFSLFQSILETQGLALVPIGRPKEGIYKIIAAKEAVKKPTPILGMDELEGMPASDELVTLVYELKYARSDDILKTIAPLVSLPNGAGVIEGTSLLRITDFASNIKKIHSILKIIDKKGETPATELVYLTHVHPQDLVNEIQPILRLKNQQQLFGLQRYLAKRLRRYVGRRGSMSLEMGAIPSSSYIPINVTAINRLKSVLVSGPQKKMEEIKKLIKKLDVQDPEEKIFYSYPIHYGDVQEISQALSHIFAIPLGETSGVNQIRGRRGRRRRRGRTRPSSLSQELAKLEKNAIIIPDTTQNAIMVVAPQRIHREVEKILKKIDIPGPQENELRYYPVRYTDLMETANILGSIFGIRVTQSGQGVAGFSWWFRSMPWFQQNTGLKFTKERVIIVDQNLKNLIVVAPRIVQEQIAETLRRVDVLGPRENVLRFYEIEDPEKVEEIAQTLSHIFNINIGYLGRRFRLPRRRSFSSKKFGVEEIIVPNPENSTILVSAPPEIHSSIEQIIEKLNSYSKEERLAVRFYKLENTNAEEISQKISVLFNLPMERTSTTSRNSQNKRRSSQIFLRRSPIRNRQNRNRRTPRRSPAESGREPISDQENENQSEKESPKTEKKSRMTNAYLYQGEPKVLADANLNSVIVIAPKDLHDEIGKLVKKLDQRRPQVMFEVAIVDVSAGDDKQLAIELGTVTHPAMGKIRFQGHTNFGNSGFDDSRNPGGFPDGRNITPPLGVIMGVVKDNAPTIPILLRALQTTTKVNIRSTPLILVNDNEQAEFRSSREEPTTTTVTGTATTNIVFSGFVDAGTTLTITPHISEGNYIRVELTLEVENFVGTPPAPGIPPAKASNYLQTSITVPDNATVIIGGLETSSIRHTVDKIPLLGDIPLLGYLFRSTKTEKLKSKLYLFIRPRILKHARFEDLRGISLKKVQEVYGKNESPAKSSSKKKK